MKNRKGMLAGFCILIQVISFFSLSGCFGWYERGGNRGYQRSHDRGDRYYYRDGRWYRRSPSGLDTVVSALFIGAMIESLPPGHVTIEIEGTPYYHDDRYYYRPAPAGGYVVIQAPEAGRHQPRNKKDKWHERGDREHGE